MKESQREKGAGLSIHAQDWARCKRGQHRGATRRELSARSATEIQFKSMKEQQYYLKTTPEISIFVPSYLLNQLVLAQAVVIKVVDLRDISNFI